MAPNRIVCYITGGLGLIAAVASAAVGFDTTSVVGMGFGLLTIAGVAIKYLEGWQKHEARQAGISLPGKVVVALDTADTVIATAEGMLGTKPATTTPTGG